MGPIKWEDDEKDKIKESLIEEVDVDTELEESIVR